MDTQRTTPDTQLEGQSRGRRVGFRVLTVVVGLWFLLLHVFGLTEVVLMWLPAETISSITGEDPTSAGGIDFVAHRSHFVAVGITSWAVVLAVVAQWRRPERKVGSMLLLMVIAVAGTIVYAFSGTLVDSALEEGLFLVVPTLLLATLHPRSRDLVNKPGFDQGMALMAGLAAIPWAVYVVSNSARQLSNVVGDAHTEMEHWSTAALMGVVLVSSALIGASDSDGWRLPAWFAVGGTALFGLHSLFFPGGPSALNIVWAVAAVAWSLAFGLLIVRRSAGLANESPS